jgi:chaperonin GroES
MKAIEGYSSRFRPVLDRLVVRRLDPVETSSAGIIIPETFREKRAIGDVLAIGPGRVDKRNGGRIPMIVQPGDRIAFAEHVGVPVRVDGEDLLIMRDRDAEGVFEGE